MRIILDCASSLPQVKSIVVVVSIGSGYPDAGRETWARKFDLPGNSTAYGRGA
jgi:hypothetical protein